MRGHRSLISLEGRSTDLHRVEQTLIRKTFLAVIIVSFANVRKCENCLATISDQRMPSLLHFIVSAMERTFTNFLPALFLSSNIKRDMDFALDVDHHLSIGSLYRWMVARDKLLVDGELREVDRRVQVRRFASFGILPPWQPLSHIPLMDIFSILFINNLFHVLTLPGERVMERSLHENINLLQRQFAYVLMLQNLYLSVGEYMQCQFSVYAF